MGYWNHQFKGDDLGQFAKPSLREKVWFCITEGASASLWYFMVLSYTTFFYTDVIGLSAGVIGTIMLVSRCLDGFTDFIVGSLIDRTKSDKGKTRVWFFWTSIPYAVFLVVAYCVPHGSTAMQIAFVAITYNLAVTVSYTLNNISWNNLTAMVTRRRGDRDQIAALRIGSSNVGGAIIGAVTLPVVAMIGGLESQRAWIITAVLAAIICYVLNILGTYNIKERVIPDPVSRQNANRDIPCTIKNVYFWGAVAIVGSYNVFQAVTMTFFPYYTTYILGDTMLTSKIMPIQSICIALACYLGAYLLNHGWKKGRLVQIGAVIALVAQIWFALMPENFTVIYITSALRGFGFGFTGAVMFAFAPDAIEYGHWRHGHRAEGTVSCGSLVGNKLGVLIGSAVTTVLLGISGYDGTAAVQTESANAMIKGVFIYFPMFFAALLFVIMLIHKMDKKYDSIMADLEAGRYHPKAKYAPKNEDK